MEKKEMGASYIAEPNIDRYYERAIEAQAQKIARQTEMLARMNRVYSRDISATKISEAIGFLVKVINNKIKKIC